MRFVVVVGGGWYITDLDSVQKEIVKGGKGMEIFGKYLSFQMKDRFSLQ